MRLRLLSVVCLVVLLPKDGNPQPVAAPAAPAPHRHWPGRHRHIGPPLATPAPTHVESIPAPTGINGVWVEFEGVRWYSNGRADVFDADRFVKIGEYYGFAVYRDTRSAAEPGREIWVEVVKDGPVAPYTKR